MGGGVADRDRAAERVADERRALDAERIEEPGEVAAQRGEAHPLRRDRHAPEPGEIGQQDTPAPPEQGDDARPAFGRVAEAMNQDQRLAAGRTSRKVADRQAIDIDYAL